MNSVDVLRRAKELLSDPERWCRGRLFSEESGQPVRWCALGALLQVGGDYPGAVGDAHAVMCNTVAGVVPVWNDDPSTTHAELIAAFDRAILSLAPEAQPALEAVSA